ncbi:hypothetical protein Tco_0226206 [Tanacetum coccineum]
MYHNKNVDYVYLMWEDLVYQVKNKNSKKNNDMYYPRFTKVIVDYFMAKDLSIPRRNKMYWHTARDDSMFTTIRVISKHQDTQIYSAILPQHLTNQAMLESEAYKTYHEYATGEKIPKPKYVKNKANPESSPKKKFAQASKGKRIKTSTKAEQIKLATKRSLIQTHSSHTSESGADKGTGVIPGVPDVATYNSGDEQISWKSSDEDDDDEVNMSEDDDNQNDDDAHNKDDDEVNVSEDDDDENDDNANNEGDDDQDDDNEQTESENDDDDLVHPKLSTIHEKERQDEEDKEEEWFDDEAYDDETKGVNVEGEELDEEQTNEEEKANELYRDVNVNLEGRDTEMTDAPQTNIQGTQVTEDTHVIITAATPEGIDSILNLNTESTSLVDVPVSTNVEMPPSSVTTLPLPPIPFIQPQQQTPVPTPTTVPSTSLQNLPTFSSLFKFEDRLKALEDNFLEFQQTNQFAVAVSLIPSIVDTYIANKMNEAVKTAVSVEDMPVDLGDVVRDFYYHMSKVRVDRIVEIETAQRRLEADQLIASGDRARMAEVIYSLRLENLKVRAMLDIKRDRVAALLDDDLWSKLEARYPISFFILTAG